jgi:hypothetical protein
MYVGADSISARKSAQNQKGCYPMHKTSSWGTHCPLQAH